MRDDDLAPFAVADGLLARMASAPVTGMTDVEQDYLVEQARQHLARIGDLTPGEAARLLNDFHAENQLTIQASDRLAVVTAYGRLLAIFARCELRGRCHPERN